MMCGMHNIAIASTHASLLSADWCGPCILLADELKKVAETVTDVDIFKLNTDAQENTSLCSQLQIQGLPTMIFVGMGNEPALRTEGLMAADSIKDIVQKMQTSHDEAIKAIEQAPTDAPEPGPASASA